MSLNPAPTPGQRGRPNGGDGPTTGRGGCAATAWSRATSAMPGGPGPCGRLRARRETANPQPATRETARPRTQGPCRCYPAPIRHNIHYRTLRGGLTNSQKPAAKARDGRLSFIETSSCPLPEFGLDAGRAASSCLSAFRIGRAAVAVRCPLHTSCCVRAACVATCRAARSMPLTGAFAM